MNLNNTMNRKHFLLTGLSLAVLGLGACSKTEEPTASTGASSAPPAQQRRTVSLEILANEGKGFTAGSIMSTMVVYVFFDPQCPHCANLWNASIPLQKKARFIWMPIGLINPTSSAQGASLLSAADPVAAMTEHEISLLAKQGGIGTSADVTDQAKQDVANNTALFNNLGLEGVPFTVAKNAQTGQMVSRGGSMQTAALAALLGIDAP